MTTLIQPDDTQFKEFFEACDIVMSAPNVAFLVGEHAVLRGTPAAVLTMPTRVYVGIKQKDSKEQWLTSKTLDSGGTLCDVQQKEERRLIGIDHLIAFAKEHYTITPESVSGEVIAGKIEGLAIRVLSDITPGSGANWSGAYSSALAACVYFGIVENVSNPDKICSQLEKWLEKWKEGDEWKSDEGFREINLLAFFLESAFHGGSASGYGTFVSLLGPTAPVVYKTCRRLLDQPPYINVYSSLVRPFDSSKGTKKVINRLQEIAGGVQLISLPSSFRNLMYIAVIDTGSRKEIGTAGAIRGVLDGLLDDLREAVKSVPGNLELGDVPDMGQVDNFWYALDYYVWAFIHFFERSLTQDQDEGLFVAKAIRYMSSVGDMLLSLGLGWKELTDISTRVWTADGVDLHNTAVKLSGGGMAGVCTLVSTKLDHAALEKILGESDCILYSSERDTQVYGLRLHKLRRNKHA